MIKGKHLNPLETTSLFLATGAQPEAALKTSILPGLDPLEILQSL